MRDARLSQRLQLDRATLTLDKAKKALRQAEAVREQHQTLQGAGGQAGDSRSNPIQLDNVRPCGATPPRQKHCIYVRSNGALVVRNGNRTLPRRNSALGAVVDLIAVQTVQHVTLFVTSVIRRATIVHNVIQICNSLS